MIPARCPNCSRRIDFGLLGLLPIQSRVAHPADLHCSACQVRVTLASWWLFVSFVGSLAAAFWILPQPLALTTCLWFALQIAANGLYVVFGGPLKTFR
ncbi:hypothetical protein AB4059_00215 [Lysobacter sp. 2RAF19]